LGYRIFKGVKIGDIAVEVLKRFLAHLKGVNQPNIFGHVSAKTYANLPCRLGHGVKLSTSQPGMDFKQVPSVLMLFANPLFGLFRRNV
jgi:hypothetical protein